MNLSKLLNNYEIPVLEPSLIKDQEQSAYLAFIERITTEPIVLPIIFSKSMKMLRKIKQNPEIIEKLKESIHKANEENEKKGKPVFEKIKFTAEDFINKMPIQFFIPNASLINVISKRAQSKKKIRDLIYEVFPLYSDDPVKFKLRLGSKVLYAGEGFIKDCSIPTEVLLQIPETDQITMLRFEIMITGRGDNRRRHEESSLIWDTNQAFLEMTSKEEMFNLFKKEMSLDLIKERAKLFKVNLDNVPAEDHYQFLKDNMIIDLNYLNFKSVSDVKTFNFRFNINESNQNLLGFRLNLSVEIDQNIRWLSNEVPEGHLF